MRNSLICHTRLKLQGIVMKYSDKNELLNSLPNDMFLGWCKLDVCAEGKIICD